MLCDIFCDYRSYLFFYVNCYSIDIQTKRKNLKKRWRIIIHNADENGFVMFWALHQEHVKMLNNLLIIASFPFILTHFAYITSKPRTSHLALLLLPLFGRVIIGLQTRLNLGVYAPFLVPRF
ncbi:hypothetical protein ARAF_0878 [Arsenophonus endosymbiont of Aleurodicus floccissimus]|nr:hypothetical protein ARAF_0878 [Arsenophonus endosymbiont of Aleurodicus floccissimus]